MDPEVAPLGMGRERTPRRILRRHTGSLIKDRPFLEYEPDVRMRAHQGDVSGCHILAVGAAVVEELHHRYPGICGAEGGFAGSGGQAGRIGAGGGIRRAYAVCRGARVASPHDLVKHFRMGQQIAANPSAEIAGPVCVGQGCEQQGDDRNRKGRQAEPFRRQGPGMCDGARIRRVVHSVSRGQLAGMTPPRSRRLLRRSTSSMSCCVAPEAKTMSMARVHSAVPGSSISRARRANCVA